MSNPLATVNEHCLKSIQNVTLRHEVVASDDIRDEQGQKLWARGQPISDELTRRLLSRKLKMPLELCLEVKTGASILSIAKRAEALLEGESTLAQLVGKQANRALALMRRTPVERTLKLLLTCAQENGDGLDHGIRVALLSSAMALRANLSDDEVMATTTGGLIHDIGELYVNPEYLHSKRALTLSEWRHVVVHPIIGKAVIQGLTKLPKEVSMVVESHHERDNGTGYPLQSIGAPRWRATAIVALAESISGILNARDNQSARVSLALRLVQGEFSPQLVNLVAPLCSDSMATLSVPAGFDAEKAFQFASQVSTVLGQTQALAQAIKEPDTALQTAVDRALQTLARLEISLQSTGLPALDGVPRAAKDAGVESEFLELGMVPREIAWRMRNLSRGLALAALSRPPKSNEYGELVDVLGGLGAY